MSMFEDDQYRWRETYFVLFKAAKRPHWKDVQKVLSELNERYLLRNPTATEEGSFESLTLISPDDFAALDICYTEGEEVEEQVVELVKDLQALACEPDEAAAVRQVAESDGRLDVLHFEQVTEQYGDEDELDEMLDPSALLLVLSALARLTGGVAVDPQAGTILNRE